VTEGRMAEGNDRTKTRLALLAHEWRGALPLFSLFIPRPIVRWVEVYADILFFCEASIRAFDDAHAHPLQGVMQIAGGVEMPPCGKRAIRWNRAETMTNPGLEWRRFARKHRPGTEKKYVPVVVHDSTGLPRGYSPETPIAIPARNILYPFGTIDRVLTTRTRYAFCRGRVSLVLADHLHPPRIIYDADPSDCFSPRRARDQIVSSNDYAEGEGRVTLATARQSHADITELLILAHHPRIQKVNSFACWGNAL